MQYVTKKPETLFSLAAVTGIIISFVYHYKKANTLQADVTKLSELLAATARKVGDLTNNSRNVDQLLEATKQLHERVTAQGAILTKLQDMIDPILDDLEELRHYSSQYEKILKANGSEIKPLRRKNRRNATHKPTRKNTRKVEESSTEESSSEVSSSEEEKKKKKKKKGKKSQSRKHDSDSSSNSDSEDLAAAAAAVQSRRR